MQGNYNFSTKILSALARGRVVVLQEECENDRDETIRATGKYGTCACDLHKYVQNAKKEPTFTAIFAKARNYTKIIISLQ